MPKLGQPSNQPPKGFSPATQALLAGRKPGACKACAGSGKSSRGGLCYPCDGKGVQR